MIIAANVSNLTSGKTISGQELTETLTETPQKLDNDCSNQPLSRGSFVIVDVLEREK